MKRSKWGTLAQSPILIMTDKESKQRTLRQNRALHAYFSLLAEALNDAGLDMRTVLKPEVDIPWTPENVKNHLWRPLQEVCVNKESTADLSTDEINKIYEVLNRHIGEKFSLNVLFPSEEHTEAYLQSIKNLFTN